MFVCICMLLMAVMCACDWLKTMHETSYANPRTHNHRKKIYILGFRVVFWVFFCNAPPNSNNFYQITCFKINHPILWVVTKRIESLHLTQRPLLAHCTAVERLLLDLQPPLKTRLVADSYFWPTEGTVLF